MQPCRIMVGRGSTPLLCHSGQKWHFICPFLRAFTSKAGMGILLFRAVSESNFAQSKRWTSFAGVHGKGLQCVCLSVSTFTDLLCRCELELSEHSSKSQGTNPVPTLGPRCTSLGRPSFPVACPGDLTLGLFPRDLLLFVNHGQP